jgi:3-hydroxyacyl-[acyl-carrier-protein] dehydratase
MAYAFAKSIISNNNLMLSPNFFKISDLALTPNTLHATLQLNAAHGIFAGHFPDLPVVPGVCLMQMVKETAEQALQQQFVLRRADHLKFLLVVNPHQVPSLQLQLKYALKDDNSVAIDAQLTEAGTAYFKMKATLKGL